jgi:hypothetical protein
VTDSEASQTAGSEAPTATSIQPASTRSGTGRPGQVAIASTVWLTILNRTVPVIRAS